jgi:hypothetical protein
MKIETMARNTRLMPRGNAAPHGDRQFLFRRKTMLMSKAEIAMMKKESLLNDVRLLTNQENDIREQIRELAIQALALQQEIRAHVEALNKSINFE